MKIACLIASLRLGGAERQMVGLAAALSRGGHEVTVLTYREGDFYCNSLSDAGVGHISLRSDSTGGIVSEIEGFVRKSGVQVLISFLTGANIKACYVKRHCPGVRVIVSERTTNLHFGPHDCYRFRLYKRLADKVVCNNFAQEEFIRRHCPSLTGMTVTIPNFVDLQRFVPAEFLTKHNGRSPAAEKDGANDVVKIVVTARVCRRKNTDGLIRAAYLLSSSRNDFRIDWYGLSDEDSYSRACLGMIHRLGLDKRFVIHGVASDVEDIYRNADIFCLPSFFEGTSNSLAEALASGLPAVCSRVGDNARYVTEGENGFLFDPHRPESVASALGKALDSDLRSLGASGRIIAEKCLSLENFEKSYLDMLSERKRIAAVTMVRNGMPFLAKWIEYYGAQLGKENIFIYLDGEDQFVPDWCRDACNMIAIPKMGLSVAEGDKARAKFLSEKAAGLFAQGYDAVIGTDIDEFVVPDPALGVGLVEFLSGIKSKTSISPLGVDIIQQVGETAIDQSKGYLRQRHFAWLCPRYTKASVLYSPCEWGSGFHRVKHRNFHICKDLYLIHLGYCDNKDILDKVVDPEAKKSGWRAHLNRRLFAIRKCNGKTPRDFDKSVRSARFIQTWFRQIFALNKPSMLGHQVIVRIPERFEGIV